MTQVIVDTGPLVAILSENDAAHPWARTVFGELEPPYFSCDVVIAEAYHLLSHTRGGADGLMALLETSGLRLTSLAELEPTSLRRSIIRYQNIPMDLADACIVRLSELHPKAKVVTIDTDFRVYRRNGHEPIPLIMPSEK